ncbi:RES family NAD+ phosphorylase [Sphingomonas sp.]|jgi:RES domain-containing protein|uniref:RES family NAD+ phosphorylase n=1 Tax=Sphingomonas sp. TaxID=28214 RepID=UPI002D8031E4|nr:RES domain-containing protein [Sphingomonas sp.]HEU0043825.1 RES domain-containing protein [Sphingomonas sp.]
MPDALRRLSGRYWRMLGVRWQRRPFESGSHVTGGRWNPMGTPALYLSADYTTAIEEAHRDLVRPGTLVAFEVEATAIADLTQAEPAIVACDWRTIFALKKGTPPSWQLAHELIAAGAEGALVPSVQNRGGTNLVLWRWRDAEGEGEGARLTLLDPDAVLGRARS